MGNETRIGQSSAAESPTPNASDSNKRSEKVTIVAENKTDEDSTTPSKPIKLYKSSRLKGYLTLVLASIVNYDAAVTSDQILSGSAAIAATETQKLAAITISLISFSAIGLVTIMHLDSFCFEKIWISLFKPKSRIELVLDVTLVLYWSVATFCYTRLEGIAGDGKGQYSMYFSSWCCCFASYWVLERWWVAAGFSSWKSFIKSWPNRSPGWLCILMLGILTLIWYLDLFTSFPKLDTPNTMTVFHQFAAVPLLQWQLLIALLVGTIFPALVFVVAEILRETKADGSIQEKSAAEVKVEGFCLLALIGCWIPCIIWVTSPGGAASLVGNSYFSSWLLVVFVAETGVWFVYDVRQRIHISLEQKQLEYREKQRQVVENARLVQRLKAESPQRLPVEIDDDEFHVEDNDGFSVDEDTFDKSDKDSNSEFVDAVTDI